MKINLQEVVKFRELGIIYGDKKQTENIKDKIKITNIDKSTNTTLEIEDVITIEEIISNNNKFPETKIIAD